MKQARLRPLLTTIVAPEAREGARPCARHVGTTFGSRFSEALVRLHRRLIEAFGMGDGAGRFLTVARRRARARPPRTLGAATPCLTRRSADPRSRLLLLSRQRHLETVLGATQETESEADAAELFLSLVVQVPWAAVGTIDSCPEPDGLPYSAWLGVRSGLRLQRRAKNGEWWEGISGSERVGGAPLPSAERAARADEA